MVLGEEKEEHREECCQRANLQQFGVGVITGFILNIDYNHLIMVAWNSVWMILRPNLDSIAQGHDQEIILL